MPPLKQPQTLDELRPLQELVSIVRLATAKEIKEALKDNPADQAILQAALETITLAAKTVAGFEDPEKSDDTKREINRRLRPHGLQIYLTETEEGEEVIQVESLAVELREELPQEILDIHNAVETLIATSKYGSAYSIQLLRELVGQHYGVELEKLERQFGDYALGVEKLMGNTSQNNLKPLKTRIHVRNGIAILGLIDGPIILAKPTLATAENDEDDENGEAESKIASLQKAIAAMPDSNLKRLAGFLAISPGTKYPVEEALAKAGIPLQELDQILSQLREPPAEHELPKGIKLAVRKEQNGPRKLIKLVKTGEFPVGVAAMEKELARKDQEEQELGEKVDSIQAVDGDDEVLDESIERAAESATEDPTPPLPAQKGSKRGRKPGKPSDDDTESGIRKTAGRETAEIVEAIERKYPDNGIIVPISDLQELRTRLESLQDGQIEERADEETDKDDQEPALSQRPKPVGEEITLESGKPLRDLALALLRLEIDFEKGGIPAREAADQAEHLLATLDEIEGNHHKPPSSPDSKETIATAQELRAAIIEIAGKHLKPPQQLISEKTRQEILAGFRRNAVISKGILAAVLASPDGTPAIDTNSLSANIANINRTHLARHKVEIIRKDGKLILVSTSPEQQAQPTHAKGIPKTALFALRAAASNMPVSPSTLTQKLLKDYLALIKTVMQRTPDDSPVDPRHIAVLTSPTI